MMKKLLILMLVLGTASIANGAISFYIDGSPAPDDYITSPGGTVTIQFYSDDASNWLAYGILRDTGQSASEIGSLSNPITYPIAGESGGMDPYVETGWAASGYETQSISISGQVAAGIQHSMLYTAGTANATIGLFRPPNYSWDQDEVDRINIIIPEPMTIGLLGVGALFLRRRRK